MKKSSSLKQTDFDDLKKFFEGKFDSIEKQIREVNNQVQTLDHNQKVSGQKNDNAYKDLQFRILAEAATTRQNLEDTLKAEIQVANTELKNELEKLETRLNKRLTHVADLITIQLGNKVQNHGKRITKLEDNVFKKPKIN